MMQNSFEIFSITLKITFWLVQRPQLHLLTSLPAMQSTVEYLPFPLKPSYTYDELLSFYITIPYSRGIFRIRYDALYAHSAPP